MQPFPKVEDERNLIPGFSLYGKDFFDPEQTPLLFDRIVASCQKQYPDLKKEEFHRPCRDEFTLIFPDYANKVSPQNNLVL
jgi:hypothetical protein